MHQIDLYLDGSPLKDEEKLSSRGIGEGGLIYFVVTNKPEPAPKPKKGLGIAAMIKQYDKEKKSVTEAGYEFEQFGLEQFTSEAKRLY